uniref:C2 domain-containing protein n=1 Tax=Panagrolaimus davidi TaxID=227884 RepID=A0A914PVG8_9BILA
MDASLPSSIYNEIEILIHRCSNLQSLTKSKQLPSTYVAYQIYDLQPHLTQIQNKNSNPVYNDSRSFTLPLGVAFHRYLKTEELQIYIVEENSNKTAKELGSVTLPLFPLARNQSIKGTFSLVASNGQVSEATIDLSIYWKYAYTFNDENVEIEQPIPVKFPKWKPISVESPKKEPAPEAEKTKTLPKSSSSESSPSVNDGTYFQSPGHRRPAPPPPSQETRAELPQPDVPSNVPHLNVPSSSSSVESSSAEDTIIENAPIEEPSHFHPDISPQPKAVIESDDDSSDTYVVDDDDLQDSGLQQKVRETSIDEIPDIPKDDEQLPPLPRIQPQPESTPTPPETDSEKNDILRRLTKMSPPTESSSEASEGSEAPEIIGLKEELEKLGREIEEDSGIKPKPPKPPLRLPPIAPPRRTTGRLEFKDPLHTSVPPSEESSIAGSINGSPRPRERTIYKSTPDLAARATSSTIKQFEQPQRPEIPHLDCSVTIRLGRLSLVEHSPLLDESFDNLNVFIEWSFLDFSSDLCETPESVALPRNTWKVETFECERIYELNSRRTALLKQWMDLNTRLSFNLVSDPQDDGDCDDLGVAQLDLSDAINTSVHSIVFHDVDGEAIAILDFSVMYSDDLTKILLADEKEEE